MLARFYVSKYITRSMAEKGSSKFLFYFLRISSKVYSLYKKGHMLINYLNIIFVHDWWSTIVSLYINLFFFPDYDFHSRILRRFSTNNILFTNQVDAAKKIDKLTLLADSWFYFSFQRCFLYYYLMNFLVCEGIFYGLNIPLCPKLKQR